jgi:CoA:oxalate CoA-transferase
MRPAYDQVIQGMSGVMSVTGGENSAPLRVGYPVCDTVGGITAALAICAALVEARTSGQGRMIDVSMLESTIASMGWVVSNYLNAGVVPIPMGNENFTAAPSGTFQTADGLLNIAANEDYQFEKLCEVIGYPELKRDPRFSDRHIRKQNRPLINQEVQRILKTKSALEWEERMIALGIPAGRVIDVPEILSHPHLAERNFSAKRESPLGEQHITRGGFYFPSESTMPQDPAPKLSQHTAEWLQKLGYSEQDIDRFKATGVI